MLLPCRSAAGTLAGGALHEHLRVGHGRKTWSCTVGELQRHLRALQGHLRVGHCKDCGKTLGLGTAGTLGSRALPGFQKARRT